ncbi:hypothetical protein V1264_017643 [Littorina saxatilis]|uniref:Ig-like domain-containing protein n=1 Tax=Littorina saxatilis TaxID=31220 RepID=A0AAN9BJJ5_9CAEN
MYLTGKMSCFVLIVVVFVHVTNTLAQTVFPETKCFEKPIPEDASLSCDCTGNGTEKVAQLPGSSFSWPGYSNTSALRLNNIRRELNGTVFVCLMQVAGEENRTANYTLQVVFGPSDDNTAVMGPSTFITDGSRDLNLTCTVTDAHPPPRISWSSPFTCDTPDSHICVFKPRVPEDDGKGVVCIATNPVFPPVKAAWAYYFLNLSYPPQTEPEISANLPTEVLRSGNTVTCTVAGGKPLVSSVIFTCTNPTLSDRDDVIGETSVSSSVVIDTALATANVTVCTCSAVWDPDPQLYANTSEAELLLEYQATVNKFTVNSTNDLSVLEDDNSSAVFQCDVTGRSSARVSMRKRGGWMSVGNTEDVTGNETDSVQRTLVHTYTVTSAKCEDMGTYTCTAESGFGDIISDSVRLTVSCE